MPFKWWKSTVVLIYKKRKKKILRQNWFCDKNLGGWHISSGPCCTKEWHTQKRLSLCQANDRVRLTPTSFLSIRITLWTSVLELLSEQWCSPLPKKSWFALIDELFPGNNISDKQQWVSSCLFSWKHDWTVNYSIIVKSRVCKRLIDEK